MFQEVFQRVFQERKRSLWERFYALGLLVSAVLILSLRRPVNASLDEPPGLAEIPLPETDLRLPRLLFS